MFSADRPSRTQTFLEEHLVLFGEDGRRRFLQLVSAELDARKADIIHRQKWRDLLAQI